MVFILILQLRHMITVPGEVYLFALYSVLIWLLWIAKTALSRRYRPFVGDYYGSASVIIPVVDEPIELFRDVLRRIVAQRPFEVIVVINGKPNPALEAVCASFGGLVRAVHTPIPGKRNAVKIGTELARGDIAVLVDSDTIWSPNALGELMRPFADPRVGGVTTRQRILEPTRSWLTRWADWLENSRALYAMPAQSVLGTVGCLPGRTIAFRRHILDQVMDEFMSARFLGVFLEVSDDRTLTNLTLKAGYRTVYQFTSLVHTDAPLSLRKLWKQQLRWARGSQYNTLRMLPWMLRHAPVLAVFYISDIVLPFLLTGVAIGWVYRAFVGRGENFYHALFAEYGIRDALAVILGLMLASSLFSIAIRQFRHLQEKPSDFLRLPVFILFSSLFLTPIRIIGFFRMAHIAGWGTRSGAYGGRADDVQSAHAAVPAEDRVLAGVGAGVRADGTALAASRQAPQPSRDLQSVGVQDAVILRPRRAVRSGPNPWAAVPYILGAAMFAVQAVFLG